MSEIRVLEVRLGATLVGHLSKCGHVHRFTPVAEYVERADRPTLSLSMLGADDRETRRRLASDAGPHVLSLGRLPPFFSNLLPEGPLRARILGERAVGIEYEFDMLAAAGAHLPGAIDVRPAQHVPPALVAWHERHAHRPLAVMPVPGPAPGAFSLAGSLDKRLFREAAHELVGDRPGACDWIGKLAAPDVAHAAENEFTATDLAWLAGVDTVEVRLVDPQVIDLPAERSAHRALCVRRFDRSPRGRVHVEDFAQVLGRHPEDRAATGENYETVGRILARLTADRVDAALELVRRLVVDVLIGNGSRHLKNIALVYPDGRAARLAPAYDTVAGVQYGTADHLALALAGEREMHRITLATFTDFADAVGVPPKAVLRCVRQTVRLATAEWPTRLAGAPMVPAAKARILARLSTLPLAVEARGEAPAAEPQSGDAARAAA